MASYKTRRDRFYQTAVHTAVASALFAAAKQPLAIEYADRHYNMGKFGPPQLLLSSPPEERA